MQEETTDGGLRAFIEAARAQGASDEFLVALLKSNGWPERDIYQAFRLHYESATGHTLPPHGAGAESSKDAFLHLLAFATLGTWASALGSLLFTLIDKYFVDVLRDNPYGVRYESYSVAWEIACMLVAFPMFLFVNRQIFATGRKQPERLESGVRKWLTYMALLITALILTGDVIYLLASMLRGELTVRFVLKSAVVFVIAGGIFAYYLGSLRPRAAGQRNMAFATGAGVPVLATVVVGFILLGSPSDQRLIDADYQRVRDLSQIVQNISLHSGDAIPSKEDFDRSIASRTRIDDPITGTPYEYTPKSATEYELCAVFDTDTLDTAKRAGRRLFWIHPKGRHCYSLKKSDRVEPIY